MIEFTAPVKLVSEANQRCHWAVRHKRFAEQRSAVWAAWRVVRGRKAMTRPLTTKPLTITLTRIGPRRLDPDNLAGSFKAAQDQLAACIGIDDGDERLSWIYKQEKGKEYAIRVRIAEGSDE